MRAKEWLGWPSSLSKRTTTGSKEAPAAGVSETTAKLERRGSLGKQSAGGKESGAAFVPCCSDRQASGKGRAESLIGGVMVGCYCPRCFFVMLASTADQLGC